MNIQQIKERACKIYSQTHNLQARDRFLFGVFGKKKERSLIEIIDRERGDLYVWEKIFGRDGHQAEIDLLG